MSSKPEEAALAHVGSLLPVALACLPVPAGATHLPNARLPDLALTWVYSGNQQLTQSWNGNYTQSGKSVTITNASWNGTVAAGATVSGIGFNANYSGTNINPTVFYVNGVQCK